MGSNIDELTAELLACQGVPIGSAPTVYMPPARRPDMSAPLVHLDLKDWVNLAKVRSGHAGGLPFIEAYEFLRATSRLGRVQVVLSGALYMEVSMGIPSERHRTDLADVMSEITRFQTLNSRANLLEWQAEDALRQVLKRPPKSRVTRIVGTGCHFAFEGREREIRFGIPDDAVKAYSAMPEISTLLYRANEIMEWMLLRGVTPEQGAEIPGYKPEAVMAIEEARLEREEDFSDRLAADSSLKRKLASLVSARELYGELGAEMPRLLLMMGSSVDEFLNLDAAELAGLPAQIPVLAVQSALRRQHHANSSRRFRSNDLRDIDQMSVAVPTCDIVVTEKHSIDVLRRAKLDQTLRTSFLNSVADLPEELERAGVRAE